MNARAWCRLYISALVAFSAHGETIRFERLPVESGLPQSTILTIVQDHQGFLWLGTYDGAGRYDGVQFKSFKHRSGDSTSLSQNLVRHIYEDRFGIIWMGTEHGLSRFNRVTETFTCYYAKPNNPRSLSSNRIRRLYEDGKGTLWITTENGLNRYDRDNDAFERCHVDSGSPGSLRNDFLRAIVEDLDGRLWLGTGGGLEMMDRATGRCVRFANDPHNPRSLSGNTITCLTVDREGTLWVGTQQHGLNRLPRGSTHFIRYRNDPSDSRSLRSDYISQVFEDQSGALWIGTYGGGLELYDRADDSFQHNMKSITDPASLSSNMVYCIFEDRTGVLFIGTEFGGLNKYDRRKNQFSSYAHEPDTPGSLSENNANAFFEDPADRGRTLWIGTRGGGLNMFDRTRGTFTSFQHDPGNPFSISDNVIRCITKDPRGNLWIGTNIGLNRFDRRSGRFVRYVFEPENARSLRNNLVLALCVDHTGTLWIGTNRGGLEEYDVKTDAFIHHQYSPRDTTTISDNSVWCIHEDRIGNLWIGTNDGGLNRFETTRRQFRRFMHNPATTNSISDNKVLCLYEDRTGILWVGTAGGGLNRFDPSTGVFSRYDEQQGLASPTVHAILEDNRGNLWISTPYGISKFNPRDETFVSFDVHDGLQSNEFHVNASCKSITGEFFFGGTNGFNVFFPDRIQQNTLAPPLAITGFQLFNRPVIQGKEFDGRILLDSSIIVTRTLHLSYRDEVFTLDFAALDFVSPEKIQYGYRIDGFDRDWNFVGNRHFATYTRLPAGHYVFRVIGSNNCGVWNRTGTTLAINISPPFWETLWFRALTVILVVGAAFSAHLLRTHRVLARTRELERHVVERTAQLQAANKELEAFAYSVSHDLRAPLRAIDGFSRILMEEHGAGLNEEGARVIAIVRDEVKRMGQLIDDLLSFSRLSRSEMHMVKIDMAALARSVCNDITTPEQRARIEFHLADIPPVPGDHALIRQVWVNLIANAVKFSAKKPAASIWIDFSESDNEVAYSVRDNGAGFDMEYVDKLFSVFHRLHRQEEFEGTGVGLAIVQRIVHRHRGRVRAEGTPDKGATFTFVLPKSLA